MGVIRNTNNLSDPFVPSDEDNLEEILQNDVPEETYERVRPRKVKQPRIPHHVDVVGLSSRGKKKSGKKFKRLENANYLLSLGEGEDTGDVSIYDFIPESVSAFAQLFMEKENMKIWNDFINYTDEEQDFVLENVCSSPPKSQKCAKNNGNENKSVDKRSDHPAFTAEDCYQKLDSDLKSIFRKQHIPLGTLNHLEEEIASFFKNHPRSVYKNQFNSFERMILHAVCQYMDLHSQSFDQDGNRWTKVKNTRSVFFPPSVMLSDYLERRFYASHKCWPKEG